MEKAKRIAQEIVEFNKKLISNADGEWDWINKNRRSKYLSSLNNAEKLEPILADMFNNEATYGIFSYDGLNSQSNLRDLDEWKKSVKNRKDIGSSFGVLPDAPRHDYFAEKILELKPKRILEIGGGYGGLILQILRRNTKVQYVNIDLPETLYLAYNFLKRQGFDVHFSLDGSIKGQITLMPNTLKVKWNPDIVFNSASLSEMKKETALSYLKNIRTAWKPKYFYHMNSDYNLFPESKRHIEFISSDFPLNGYNLIYRLPTGWQGGGGRYREFLYKRK